MKQIAAKLDLKPLQVYKWYWDNLNKLNKNKLQENPPISILESENIISSSLANDSDIIDFINDNYNFFQKENDREGELDEYIYLYNVINLPENALENTKVQEFLRLVLLSFINFFFNKIFIKKKW